MSHFNQSLVDEQYSPLFRLMWVHNIDDINNRSFENNICAFHIGKGYIISVAHNLRSDAGTFRSISDADFQTNVIPKIAPNLAGLFNQVFVLDPTTQIRKLNGQNPAAIDTVVAELNRINFPKRWLDLMNSYDCKIVMVVNFRDSEFYNDPSIKPKFQMSRHFTEPRLGRHTFLVEVELVKAFYEKDIAIYKMINVHPDIIAKIPRIDPDLSLLNKPEDRTLYCLQSAPSGVLGRLLNSALTLPPFIEQFRLGPQCADCFAFLSHIR